MLRANMGFLNSEIATEQLNLKKEKKTNMSKRAYEARKTRSSHVLVWVQPACVSTVSDCLVCCGL
ncbi:unnamed protein product [Brassica oleracea]